MTTVEGGPKLLKKFRKFLKSQDAFGHKISLNYQNQPTFRSSVGGFMTIALRLLLLGYFLSNLVTVINRSQSAIVNSIYKKDLSFDDTSFNLTKNVFDMALFISYFGTDDGVQENIHTYFTANFYQIYFEDNPYTWGTGNDWVYMPIGLEICKEGRFLGENKTAKLINITGNYLCPEENFNLKLSGVNTADSWLTSNLFGNEFVYYTGRLEYTQIGTRELDAGWSLFSVEIDMDEGYVKTGRTVMTILDAFSIVGGLMGITFAFFQYFMEAIQEKLFMSSIISKIFYQTNPVDQEEGVHQLNSIGKMPQKQYIQNKLYQKARNTIENEFDIVRVIKTVRKVDLIFKTMFSKYQSFFIPILRNNVLSKNDIKLRDADFNIKEIQEIKKIDDNKLKIFISSLIMQSEKSKIDKRILKNLSDEYRQNISNKKLDLEKNKVGAQLKKNFLGNLASKLDTNLSLKKYNKEDEWSF
ncbi:UNKNOWN [Stylonychia lemnae]|uniref:Uncharacterized protein n=1 Tax=Stylonychia lemnae TaxID=5949 RepID=A0A078A9L6_STYLE|nr:UNKNOWN [Stylonychia lemnae]|eukprot:CDW78965.1 UNKNOWN [Stylonychia lemnae]